MYFSLSMLKSQGEQNICFSRTKADEKAFSRRRRGCISPLSRGTMRSRTWRHEVSLCGRLTARWSELPERSVRLGHRDCQIPKSKFMSFDINPGSIKSTIVMMYAWLYNGRRYNLLHVYSPLEFAKYVQTSLISFDPSWVFIFCHLCLSSFLATLFYWASIKW